MYIFCCPFPPPVYNSNIIQPFLGWMVLIMRPCWGMMCQLSQLWGGGGGCDVERYCTSSLTSASMPPSNSSDEECPCQRRRHSSRSHRYDDGSSSSSPHSRPSSVRCDFPECRAPFVRDSHLFCVRHSSCSRNGVFTPNSCHSCSKALEHLSRHPKNRV